MKREAVISSHEMTSTDAPTHVGEPLIQVISETVLEENMTPELFTPPEPTPTLDSANLMDGTDPPRSCRMLC